MAVRGLALSSIIIAAGILLLMFNVGALPAKYKPIIFSWQMLIITAGAYMFVFCRLSKAVASALIIIGSFWMLSKFEIDGFEFLKDNVLPIFCIVVGIFFMFHILFEHRRGFKHRLNYNNHSAFRHWQHKRGSVFVIDDENGKSLDCVCVFGSEKHKIGNPIFKGGEVTCVCSNFELDMSETCLARGKNILEITTTFGTCILYVPANWNIKICQTKAFGTFEDKRISSAYNSDADSSLIITGVTAFGGSEIRSHENRK
jgi:predicted membrane protein